MIIDVESTVTSNLQSHEPEVQRHTEGEDPPEGPSRRTKRHDKSSNLQTNEPARTTAGAGAGAGAGVNHTSSSSRTTSLATSHVTTAIPVPLPVQTATTAISTLTPVSAARTVLGSQPDSPRGESGLVPAPKGAVRGEPLASRLSKSLVALPQHEPPTKRPKIQQSHPPLPQLTNAPLPTPDPSQPPAKRQKTQSSSSATLSEDLTQETNSIDTSSSQARTQRQRRFIQPEGLGTMLFALPKELELCHLSAFGACSHPVGGASVGSTFTVGCPSLSLPLASTFSG